MSQKEVVTRFAPSPTGTLHIGGLRTALYSYLMAKVNKGKFILRIEDTDRTRYVEESVSDIIDSLKWAGLNWDEGPVYQSERLDEYKKYADQLLESDKAYRCFCSAERLTELRETQKQEKKDIGYDRKCRSLSKEEVDAKISSGETFTVRLKLPESGEIKVSDLVRGSIDYNYENLEDLVVVKTDGFPTYHLAHVVDDSLMGVTHVFRGTEWIPTSPMHAFMFDALGFERIEYVHLPLILSPDGGKLSKRHGATSVKEFISLGYTKEGLINYLSLLGWSLDDKTEDFTLESLEEVFDPKRISKSAATFAYDKLNHFNSNYIKKYDDNALFDLLTPHLVGVAGEEKFKSDSDMLKKVVALYKDRLVVLSEIGDYIKYFYDDSMLPKSSDEFEFKKLSTEDIKQGLELSLDIISGLESWDLDLLNKAVKEKTKEAGVKMHHVFMPLRKAVTGTAQTPSISDLVILLGKDLVVSRLEKSVALFK
jgi:nondiscriminating glutamyl-tRNA synthetase